MVARSIWRGVISFGMVAVPVSMYPATREHEVSFHQFQRGTGDRIRYQRINERTGEEVEFEEIVKGTNVGDGDYVMIEPEELEEIAPGRSRSLEIRQFVDLEEIDPLFYQKTYYLGPESEESVKTYALLRDAMADTNRAAIATFVMRGREYLATIRADGSMLVLETMYFADEVRDPEDVLEIMPGPSGARREELRMATQLIDSMTGKWEPSDFRDTYTDRVRELIMLKREGQEVVAAEEAPQPTNVVDLMEALRRSVDAARKRRAVPAGRGGSRTVSAPAGRGTAKRSDSRKAAGDSRKAAGRRAGGKSDLSSVSKTELSDMARQLNIAGRSSMNRDELEKAVASKRR
jgi:DNA end-binding protein Ku